MPLKFIDGLLLRLESFDVLALHLDDELFDIPGDEFNDRQDGPVSVRPERTVDHCDRLLVLISKMFGGMGILK
jgi:hypothetical protein